MANKEMVIKVSTDTKDLDSAINKVGELKEVTEGSPIKIQYDIDGKPLEVVLEKSVNLRAESKLLFSELQKLTREGKTQSAEFGLLSSKYNETKSALAAVDARSRDLFASLSLIPGPIGDIAGKLNGAIGLLKTFSSFSVKDITNQIKGLGKDLLDVINNFYGINKATTNTTGSINVQTGSLQTQTTAYNDNTDAQQDNIDALDDGTAATNAGTVANQKQTDVIKGSSKATTEYLQIVKNTAWATTEFIKPLKDLTGVERELAIEQNKRFRQNIKSNQTLINEIEATEKYKNAKVGEVVARVSSTGAVYEESTAIKENTTSLTQNTGAKEVNTVVQKGYNAAVETGTFVTNAFNIALKALGIGIIIGAVTLLADTLYRLVKSFFTAEDKIKDFKDSMLKGAQASAEATNKILEVGVAFEQAKKGAISKTKALETYNQILGGTIGEAKTLEEAEKLYNANTNNYIKATGLRAEAQELFAIAAKKSAEAVEAEERGFFSFDRGLFESYDEELQKRKDKLNNTASELRNKATDLLKQAGSLETGYKPKEVKTNKVEQAKNDNDEYLKMMQEYRDNNRAKVIQDERKREDEELKIKKEGEDRKIGELKLTNTKIDGVMVTAEQKRANLLKEVREKYALEVINLNKKRVDEDLKKMQEDAEKALKLREDFLKKMASILDDSYESETMRAKAARETKYKDDKAALEKDLVAVKATEEEKQKLLLALKAGFDRDIKKIDDDKKKNDADEKIKKLDEELKFLEMNAEASKNSFIEYWKIRQQILDTSKARELAATDLTEKQKLDIEKKYATLAKQLQKEKFDAYLSYAQAALSAASNIFSKQGEINSLQEKNELDSAKRTIASKTELAAAEDEIKKKYFYKNRDAQAAQAVINTLQAAISAYASLAVIPVVGPVLGGIAAAAALVFGYKQVAAIKAQEYTSSSNTPSEASGGGDSINRGKNYGDGGMIEGPRHAAGGTMINAEGGEAIMTRGAVTMFKPLLSMMNVAGGGTSFTPGAVGGAKFDNPKTDSNPMDQPIIKTYVVESDMTTIQHRQARLKSLSTL